MDLGLGGSVCLVTGSTSGIGLETARLLAAEGARVVTSGRRGEAPGVGEALHVAADLAEPGERDRLAAEVERIGREVDVLVNNAGFGVYGRFVDNQRERELKQLRLLVEAVVDLSARYLPGMVTRDSGAVINLSSTSGLQPLPHNAGYSAAKVYVEYFSEAIHTELANTNVTVTAVLPGPVRTGFQEASDADYFAERLPGFTFVAPERVAEDALRAAERGKRTVIPGGPHVKASFRPNRFAPRRLQLAVAKRTTERPEDSG